MSGSWAPFSDCGSLAHTLGHRIPQLNHRHGEIAVSAVAGDGVKTLGADHMAGRIHFVASFDQG